MLRALWICHALTAGAIAAAVSSPVAAEDSVAAMFGAREWVQDISLSPDGTHAAIVTPTAGRGATLVIADLVKGGEPKAIGGSSGDPERLTDCRWANDTRLICNIYTIGSDLGNHLYFTRLVSVGRDDGKVKVLSPRTNARSLWNMQDGGAVIDWVAEGTDGGVLMTRMFVPEKSIGTRLASDREGLAVERVDPVTASRHIVEQPRRGAIDYLSDGHGTIRMMGVRQLSSEGYEGNQIHYFYRLFGKNDWKPFGDITVDGDTAHGLLPQAVDHELDSAYGFDANDGRLALFRAALDGSMKRELVFARPDVDVDDLIRVGRQNRVVGVSFVTDHREAEFFDPELSKLRVSLGKALPGEPLVTFVDASADESQLLLFAGSDVNPGRYFLYHKATHELEGLLPARPQLRGVTLAPVKSITYPATDGTPIPAYLTLPVGDGKNVPAIVMPHGGPASRDEWGFDWLAQFFAARGFAVLQPNFRGSSGYGDAWYQKNGFQSWRTAIGDVVDAGRWLNAQGIAAPGRLAIVGWSYGGYAALQASVLDPDLFKAIVAIAPVTDLEALRRESRNYSNFKTVDATIGHGAHVTEGSPARNAARIKAPVLMFHGDLDINVDIDQSRLMVNALKDARGKVELVEFRGLDHQLDDDTARTAMLDKADKFLRQSLGL